MGYDPADVYVHCHARNRTTKTKTKTKTDPSANIVTTTRGDLHILGSNKQLYRGRIDTCEIMPLKEKERKLTRQDNAKFGKMNLDQLDQTVKNEIDEHLFAYLDWDKQFNEHVIVLSTTKRTPVGCERSLDRLGSAR